MAGFWRDPQRPESLGESFEACFARQFVTQYTSLAPTSKNGSNCLAYCFLFAILALLVIVLFSRAVQLRISSNVFLSGLSIGEVRALEKIKTRVGDHQRNWNDAP